LNRKARRKAVVNAKQLAIAVDDLKKRIPGLPDEWYTQMAFDAAERRRLAASDDDENPYEGAMRRLRERDERRASAPEVP
jgi:hypothetical protein